MSENRPRNMTLYELQDAYAELEEHLIASEGELTPEIEEFLDKLQDAEEIRVDQILRLHAQFYEAASAARVQSQRLQDLARARFKAADNLKSHVEGYLKVMGKKKLTTPNFTVTRVKNSQPAVRVDPGADLPKKYRKAPPPQPKWEPDTKALAQAWKDHVKELRKELQNDPDYYVQELKKRDLKVSAAELAEVMAEELFGEGVKIVQGHHIRIR